MCAAPQQSKSIVFYQLNALTVVLGLHVALFQPPAPNISNVEILKGTFISETWAKSSFCDNDSTLI